MLDITVTWPGNNNSDTSGAEVKEAVPAIILPNEGKVVHAFNTEITFLLGGAQTGGKYTVFTETTPPGGGPPPHYHENEDEWFYPLEGRVEFFLGGVWQEVPPHSIVFLPRGTVHTFRNAGDTPSKMIIHTSPSGFETFFERCAVEFAKDGPPDMGRISEIAAEHGIYFVTE